MTVPPHTELGSLLVAFFFVLILVEPFFLVRVESHCRTCFDFALNLTLQPPDPPSFFLTVAPALFRFFP